LTAVIKEKIHFTKLYKCLTADTDLLHLKKTDRPILLNESDVFAGQTTKQHIHLCQHLHKRAHCTLYNVIGRYSSLLKRSLFVVR